MKDNKISENPLNQDCSPLLIIKEHDISGTDSTLDNIKDSINVDKRPLISDSARLTVTFEEAMHMAGGFGKDNYNHFQ